jgi:hypothetical protein
MPEVAPTVDLATLARDIAIEYLGLPAILRAHEISDDQWEVISRNAEFQAMAAQMRREWQSASNARERVKMKASTAVEALLPGFIEDIVNPAAPLAQKTEAIKLMAKLGEIGETVRDARDTGERISVTINIGEGVTKTIEATAVRSEASTVALIEAEPA